MTVDELKAAKIELALALAQGVSVTAWARARSMPRSTVYRWASDPEVRSEIEAHRRQAVDRAIGVMANRYAWAANGIVNLAKTSGSDSVKLKAFRSVMTDMIAVSRFSGWDNRLADLEEKVGAQRQGPKFQRGPLPPETLTSEPQVPCVE